MKIRKPEPIHQVFERPIRQRVKIFKDIYTNPDGTYDNNTYGADETEAEPGFSLRHI